ncbi:ABC transporter substrate-binding protein [Rhizobium sp. B230/85]|uniref:ABC transporter substrate-binding protein n=1 Tax=unclassified Rhizobium TaxID=2613769 RepID=UPI001AD96968|nr:MULTISPECIES: ABC transporter substrate-binding protein [unclassified Rhizobium]MBO9136469.1 ABC transporter substrate-binding protein [Rhizobium sp. B209b/85]QXZ98668.1 ABC transporter substrate-binding protein [Rhizobium sp. B230/85]
MNRFETKKTRRAISALAMATALGTIAFAASAKADTIKIGILVQLTGASSLDGQEVVKGSQLEVDEINAAGGIDGHKFELVIADTRDGAASDVTAAVERLIGDPDVHFVAAGYASLTSFEIDNMAEAEMPYVVAGPSGQTRGIIEPDPSKYWCCWSMMPAFEAYNTDVTRLVDKLAKAGSVKLGDPKKVALVSSDNAYSSTIYKGMKEEIGKSGWTQTVDEVVPFGEVNDWRTILSKVRQTPPDLVVNLDYLPANSASFLNQFMENPTKSLVFLQYAPSVPEFTKLTGKNSEGVIYGLLGGTIANEKNLRGLEVTSKFKQKYGTDIGTYGVVLYETINLYFDALRKVKDPANHKAIAEAIGASDKDVAEGHLKFDPKTHLAMQGDDNFPIQFYQIQDGSRVLISPEKYATGSFKSPTWTK